MAQSPEAEAESKDESWLLFSLLTVAPHCPLCSRVIVPLYTMEFCHGVNTPKDPAGGACWTSCVLSKLIWKWAGGSGEKDVTATALTEHSKGGLSKMSQQGTFLGRGGCYHGDRQVRMEAALPGSYTKAPTPLPKDAGMEGPGRPPACGRSFFRRSQPALFFSKFSKKMKWLQA